MQQEIAVPQNAPVTPCRPLTAQRPTPAGAALYALFIALLLLFGGGSFFPAHAASDVLSMTSEDTEPMNWNLEADKLTTLSNNSIIEAEGGVVLTRGDDILKADFARYYADTNWVYLKGNVFVRMGRDDIHSEAAEFDLRSKTGWLTNGNVFMEGPHIYFSGERIVKHWGDRYTFNEAKITTCDGDNPAWSMKAQQAVVEIDGYAQLFDSTFDVKETGIFYSPFMILPAKTSRQSGLLFPDYGISNKRGVYYTQPYYWAIDESRDMTFYGGWMSKIGPQLGVEYRANEFTDQKTWLTASGIFDKNTVSSAGDSHVYESSSLLRNNHDRYWIRGMADGFLGASTWRYRSNIDYVSDQDFLREFNQGPLGFDRSRSALFNMFGRDLQEDDQNRVSAFQLSNDWDRIGVVAGLRYEQDPSLGHGNRAHSQDELVQQLPQLDAFLYKGRIFEALPLEVEAQFETGYMYRAKGTSGWRSELYPTLTLPLDLGVGSLIGTMGLRQTYYNTERKDHTSPLALYNSTPTNPRQTGESRTMVDMDIQGYTEASRVWQLGDGEPLAVSSENVGKRSWTALRHEVQPRMRYRRTPRVDQDQNPFYIMDDRILPTNELTYSITNIFTRKGTVITAKGKQGEEEFERGNVYQDILRWRVETGYDFEEEKRTKHTEQYARRPFMDVLSEIDWYMLDWVTYNSKLYVSTYDGSLSRADNNLYFTFSPWLTWGNGISFRDKYYDYRRKFQYDDWQDVRLTSSLRLLRNYASLNITPEWSLAVDDYRNMREGGSMGKAYDQRVELTYKAQCYRIVGQYRYDGYDRSFSVMVELPGIFD